MLDALAQLCLCLYLLRLISQSASTISMTLASIALIVLVGSVTYRFLVYPLLLSPLAKIPSGHPTAAVSPLWILWVRWTGKENATIYQLHRKYGPLVRLGPAEISVDGVDGGIRTVSFGRHALR